MIFAPTKLATCSVCGAETQCSVDLVGAAEKFARVATCLPCLEAALVSYPGDSDE